MLNFTLVYMENVVHLNTSEVRMLHPEIAQRRNYKKVENVILGHRT